MDPDPSRSSNAGTAPSRAVPAGAAGKRRRAMESFVLNPPGRARGARARMA